MYTLFLSGKVVVSFKENATPEDLATYNSWEYVTRESLPEGLEGNVGKVTWDKSNEVVVPLPAPPDPGPTMGDRIVALEEENINLMLALTQVYEEKEVDKAAMQEESINTMLAITELYELMIGGN